MFSAGPKSNRNLASSPTHQLTSSPTRQLTSSPTHQLTNSPAHQLANFKIVAQFRVVAVTLSLDSKKAFENLVLP
jgi:hypothetical protein